MEAKTAKSKYVVNLCEGPLLKQVILFAFPLFMSFLLQLFFNTADLLVVGRKSSMALAAVGSTVSLFNLCVCIFIGMSVGTNVVVANFYGAKEEEKMSQTINTSIFLALIFGIFLAAAGQYIARPILVLMNTPADILDKAELYMKICFAGMPFMQIYNFGSAVLRALGDTRRPLYFLAGTGVLNVLLNIFFVFYCDLDVEGVGWATVIAQIISSILVICTLAKLPDAYCLNLKKLKINRAICNKILAIGIPSGLQSSCYSLSNTMLQASINSFGSMAVAGCTAAVSLESITWACCGSFHQTAISFTAQNTGGKRPDRIRKALWYCFIIGTVLASLMGNLFYQKGNFFLGLFKAEPEAIAFGLERLKYSLTFYALCAMQDIYCGGARGLGFSTGPAFVSFFCICVFRIAWIYAIFPYFHTITGLFVSYPVSWAASLIFMYIYFEYAMRKTFPKGKICSVS